MSYTAEQLIATATAEIGYLEKLSNDQLDDQKANKGNNNWNKYARDLHNAGYYNADKNGYAWCAIFVDWCHYVTAGRNSAEGRRVSCQTDIYSCDCNYSKGNYKEANRLFTSPLPGDQIFFYKDSGSDRISHTGIVYKVDSTHVYTIEGNTKPNTGVENEGNGVYQKIYSLNYSRIAGYGRPLYSDTPLNFETPFTANTEAVQSATAHNFFNITLKEIFSTKAIIQVASTKSSEHAWSYQLTDLTNNTEMLSKKASLKELSNLILSNLNPNTPYTLKVTAKSDSLESSQQIYFPTLQEFPESVQNLMVSFNTTNLFNKKFKISFTSPDSWGSRKDCQGKGYRTSLVRNGKILAYSDTLISYNAKQTINEDISLSDFLQTSKGIELDCGDTLQIGVQTWIKIDNKIILSQQPVCSQAVYLKYFLNPVEKIYIKNADNFECNMLWHKE